ncbi:MAG: tyrosine-type recombinase/integrase [Parvibaculum sp.]|nr:tyrosine-type recombinase/integrase [Parvibaculum sp.]
MTTRARLTKRAVDAITAPGFVWDSDLTGFHVRTLATGRKTYGLQYRDRNGRQHRPKIGVHGQISAEQARDIARAWIVDVAAGGTPGSTAGGGDGTMRDLQDRYMKGHALTKKETSRALDEIYWRVHILPKIGNLPVRAVTPADIEKVLSALKDKPATRNRVRACLHKAFELAEGFKPPMRARNTNPVKESGKSKESRGVHRYLPPVALAKLGMALRIFEAAGGDEPTYIEGERNLLPGTDAYVDRGAARMRFAGLIMLLLVTGCRKREWMHGRWAWVDIDAGLYRLPDSKTGAKNVLLSPHAVAVLRKLYDRRNKSNPFIFPGLVKGKPLRDESRQWAALLKVAGLGKVRIHDLRHSFASAAKVTGQAQGFGVETVADLLHHSDEAVTAIYADLFDDTVRAAQNHTADALIGWLGPIDADAAE